MRPRITEAAARQAAADAAMPDLPASQSPPGRAPEGMDADQLHLVLYAVTRLHDEVTTMAQQLRAGSKAYHDAGHLAGRLATTRNQLRRAIAGLAEPG